MFKDAQGHTLPVGMIDGNFHQIVNQAVGVSIAIVLALVGAYLILTVVNFTMGVRVSTEDEVQGLDLTQHGEEGYYWEASMP
jgi:ammonium transporter, Amt family